MVFTSFEPFLYARTDLRFLRLKKVGVKKGGKYCHYELCGEKNELFKHTAVSENLFSENDEIVLTNLRDKIILFKNFSKNLDNFKEAKLRHIVFTLLFFVATCVFTAFCVMNDFAIIDISFFALFFVGFIAALINFNLLRKQIKILSTLSKGEFIAYSSKSA